MLGMSNNESYVSMNLLYERIKQTALWAIWFLSIYQIRDFMLLELTYRRK